MKVSQATRDFMNNVMANIGLLLVLLATAVPFFMAGNTSAQQWYPYIFGTGALICFVARCFVPYRTMAVRLKRWYRIQLWGALFFCVAAAFLFWPGQSQRDWLAFTLAGAALQAICSIMIPIQARKAEK
ncbi:MAG: hypothetical protein K2F99_06955 [Muribaculaceae bacterium]|nr:hypothetical protein [Bacteroidales bacterium]MDE6041299.1 hypothetical protein [Muribaculaceae bacterium]